MNKKYLLVSMFILVGIVILSNGAFAQDNESNYAAEYDFDIINAFENETLVRVVVRLTDNSGIEMTGTKEQERINLLKQRDKWFEPIVNEVISSLSEDEAKDVRKHADGFSVDVTKEGFNKLVNDIKISEIILAYTGEGHATLDVSEEQVDEERIADAQTKQEYWLSNLLTKIVQFIKSLFSK